MNPGERKIETYNQLAKKVLKSTMHILNGVSVPIRLPNGYQPVKVYPLDILEDHKLHRRLKVFYNKGVKCVVPGCECEGIYMIRGMDCGGQWHLDLYTKDFILMTVDHIHPRSLGGSNLLDNLQPMCEPHNSRKAHHIMSLEELALK